MSHQNIDKYTKHFYDWEKLGRGWHFFENPVHLEPEFLPFIPLSIPQTSIDEGRRPTLLEQGLTFVKNTLLSQKRTNQTEAALEIYVNGYEFKDEQPLRIYSVIFPDNYSFQSLASEQLLIMLSACRWPVSFEVLATYTYIRYQFVCREFDAAYVFGQLQMYFPTCRITEQLKPSGAINSDYPGAYIDLGLKEEFMRPLAIPVKTSVDPLTGIFGILEYLQPEDTITWQTIFQSTVNPWAIYIHDSVTDGRGDSFFIDAPEMPELAKEKVSSPLFAVTTRILTQSKTQSQAHQILDKVISAIHRLTQSEYNSLIPLSAHLYTADMMLRDIELRQSHRVGMLLNSKELASFIRLPSETIQSKKLERDTYKTKPAPRIAEGYEFILGKNIHQGIERIPTLSTSQHLKHMHVIGATGTGKSTFLQSCIVQDIHLGNGIAVLDPHGDLIEGLLPYIPESRYKDVIIVDPSDSEHPIGFNILTAHSEIEKEILASDLVSVFRRLSTSFGDQMHSVLANAILAFLESSTGGTLIDLRKFLIEKAYRDEFLKTVSDPSIVYYWHKEYPMLKTSSSYTFKQCRFTFTIISNNSYTVLLRDSQIDILKQHVSITKSHLF